MTVVQMVTALLAIYGAVLSTATFAVLLLSKRWRLYISVGAGHTPNGGERIALYIANAGERPITLIDIFMNVLQNVHFWLSIKRLPIREAIQRLHYRHSSWSIFFNREFIVTDPYPFPVEIMPGRTVTVQFDSKKILDSLTDDEPTPTCIFFTITDALGNDHDSPPFSVDVTGRRIDFY
jgi:hypothetical protein